MAEGPTPTKSPSPLDLFSQPSLSPELALFLSGDPECSNDESDDSSEEDDYDDEEEESSEEEVKDGDSYYDGRGRSFRSSAVTSRASSRGRKRSGRGRSTYSGEIQFTSMYSFG